MLQLLNTVLNMLLSGLETILSGMSDIAVSAVKGNRKEQYNADFLKAGKVLFKNETGFCLTGDKSLMVRGSESHAAAGARVIERQFPGVQQLPVGAECL
jgi:hypothetical protein